jgi:hypothetical protein
MLLAINKLKQCHVCLSSNILSTFNKISRPSINVSTVALGLDRQDVIVWFRDVCLISTESIRVGYT